MQKMPKLKHIREILFKNLFMRNDILAIKLVLDIYDDYCRSYDIDNYKELISTALLFYYSIGESDVENLYDIMKERSIYKIDRNRVLFRTRRQYIKHYKKEKNNLERLNNCFIKII
jgi:hypothetical protein